MFSLPMNLILGGALAVPTLILLGFKMHAYLFPLPTATEVKAGQEATAKQTKALNKANKELTDLRNENKTLKAKITQLTNDAFVKKFGSITPGEDLLKESKFSATGLHEAEANHTWFGKLVQTASEENAEEIITYPELQFFISEEQAFEGKLTLQGSTLDNEGQSFKAILNGSVIFDSECEENKKITHGIMQSGLEISFKPALIKQGAINRLTIELPDAKKSGSNDQRHLSLAVKSMILS